MSVWQTASRINAMLLRPFRQQVDITTAVLLFVLLLTIAGQWHLILAKVEMSA